MGAVIGGVAEGAESYKASKADAEETIKICTELRDKELKELGMDIEEVEKTSKDIAEKIGEAEDQGRTIYSDVEDRRSRF